MSLFSSTSHSPSNPSGHQSHEYQRPSYGHAHSQSFTVAGMSNTVAHSPSLRSSTLGGGPGLGSSQPFGMGDSLSQSRSHYQPGYLMSANPNVATSSSPRYDEPPIVQTKAKLNNVFSGSSAADFGMDSMFESSSRQKQRQTLTDEDAPPTTSVNDIINENYDFGSTRRSGSNFETPGRASLFRPLPSQTPISNNTTNSPSTSKPLYIIVFGYPPDKYSTTVEYFRSLGSSTDADPSATIVNCFRIGYTNSAEAMRAVRKNGETLGGTWMIGVKWADPAQAEAILGPSGIRNSLTFSPPEVPSSPDFLAAQQPQPTYNESPLTLTTNVPRGSGPGTPTVGTPIRLAPSQAAFRKGAPGGAPLQRGTQPMEGIVGALPVQPATQALQPSQSRGVLGQVSDLIFGW